MGRRIRIQAEPSLPSASEVEAARQFLEALRLPGAGLVACAGSREAVAPAKLVDLVARLAECMAAGSAPVIVPYDAELTTQQAADLLNVSRPHLISLLERGQLSCRRVGNRRKLDLKEVLAFRQERSELRKSALAEIAADAQEAGVYDARIE